MHSFCIFVHKILILQLLSYAMSSVFYKYKFLTFHNKLCEVGTIIIVITQKRKLSHRQLSNLDAKQYLYIIINNDNQ